MAQITIPSRVQVHQQQQRIRIHETPTITKFNAKTIQKNPQTITATKRVRTELEQVQGMVEQVRKDFEKRDSINKTLQKAIFDKKMQLQDLVRQTGEHGSNLGALAAQVTFHEHKIKAASDDLKDIEEDIKSFLEKDIKAFSNVKLKAETLLAEMSDENSKLMILRDEIHQELQPLQENLRSSQEKYTVKSDLLLGMTERVLILEKDIKTMEMLVESEEQQTIALRVQNENLTTELKRQQELHSTLTSQLAFLSHTINTLQQQELELINKFETDIDELREELQQLGHKKIQLEAELHQHQLINFDIDKELQLIVLEIEEMKREIDKNDTITQQLTRQHTQQLLIKANLEITIQQLTNETTVIEEEISQKKSKLIEAISVTENLEKELDDHLNRIKSNFQLLMETSKVENSKKWELMQLELLLSEKTKKQQMELQKLEHQIAELVEEKEALLYQLKSKQKVLEKIEADTSNASDKINNIILKIADIKTENKELQENLANRIQESKISANKTNELQKLQEDTDTLQQSNNTENKKMIELQSVCEKLQEECSISATDGSLQKFHNIILPSKEYQQLLQQELDAYEHEMREISEKSHSETVQILTGQLDQLRNGVAQRFSTLDLERENELNSMRQQIQAKKNSIEKGRQMEAYIKETELKLEQQRKADEALRVTRELLAKETEEKEKQARQREKEMEKVAEQEREKQLKVKSIERAREVERQQKMEKQQRENIINVEELAANIKQQQQRILTARNSAYVDQRLEKTINNTNKQIDLDLEDEFTQQPAVVMKVREIAKGCNNDDSLEQANIISKKNPGKKVLANYDQDAVSSASSHDSLDFPFLTESYCHIQSSKSMIPVENTAASNIVTDFGTDQNNHSQFVKETECYKLRANKNDDKNEAVDITGRGSSTDFKGKKLIRKSLTTIRSGIQDNESSNYTNINNSSHVVHPKKSFSTNYQQERPSELLQNSNKSNYHTKGISYQNLQEYSIAPRTVSRSESLIGKVPSIGSTANHPLQDQRVNSNAQKMTAPPQTPKKPFYRTNTLMAPSTPNAKAGRPSQTNKVELSPGDWFFEDGNGSTF